MKKTILTALAAIAIAFSSNAQVSTVDTTTTIESVVIIKNNNKPEHLPSFYLKRGAKRQMGGILTSVIGNIAGAAIIGLSQAPSTTAGQRPSQGFGIGVMSVSTLVGSILYISGIKDYGMAGRALEYNGQ